MITNAILIILLDILKVLLLPLSALNVAIDFVGSIPVITQFLQVVAYVLPWDNFFPLFVFIVSMFIFRGGLSLIKIIWHFIPIIGN